MPCGTPRRSIAAAVGRCGARNLARIASYGPHFGEEQALVGWQGSGTVFFSGCKPTCIYCQNASISQEREGTEVSDRQLAGISLEIQRRGCHNLNLVTPTPHAAAIARALAEAAHTGWSIPIVWNCGGYESVEVLRCLDGVVDVYMPDIKYGDDGTALRMSGIEEYVARSREAVREMFRQTGNLMIDAGGLEGTDSVLRFLANDVSPGTAVHVMSQYRPCYRANEIPVLRRRVSRTKSAQALQRAEALGLRLIA